MLFSGNLFAQDQSSSKLTKERPSATFAPSSNYQEAVNLRVEEHDMGPTSAPASPHIFRQPPMRLQVDKGTSYEDSTSNNYDTGAKSPSESLVAIALRPMLTPSNVCTCKEQRPEDTEYHLCPHCQNPSCSATQGKGWEHLWSASLEPPITCQSLRELEWDQLSNNLLLRHDLNFNPHIQYRPNTNGCRGKERMLETCHYWDAVRVEISMGWENRSRRSLRPANICHTTPAPGLGAENTACPIPRRLPIMFETIRETMKTLAPECSWYTIDERLDAVLLAQKLNHDVCDMISLSDWFGQVLRPFCSPERYSLFSLMTSTIKRGMHEADAEVVVDGLKRLFSIMETMKLDFANHRIRCLRLATVEDTVSFEQQDFLGRIADGWDPSEARTWLAQLQSHQTSKDTKSSQFPTFVRATTDLVTSNSDYLPSTFTLDYIRLRVLQIDFQTLVYQVACRQIFVNVVKTLKGDGSIPQSAYNDLYNRISVIISTDESDHEMSQRNERVALEVVRAAYKFCRCAGVPSSKHLSVVECELQRHCVRKGDTVKPDLLEKAVSSQIQITISQEVKALKGLSPDQITKRYLPENARKSMAGSTNMQTDMLRIAQRTAHITVLHWRVWAPILYEQPVKISRHRASTFEAGPRS